MQIIVIVTSFVVYCVSYLLSEVYLTELESKWDTKWVSNEKPSISPRACGESRESGESVNESRARLASEGIKEKQTDQKGVCGRKTISQSRLASEPMLAPMPIAIELPICDPKPSVGTNTALAPKALILAISSLIRSISRAKESITLKLWVWMGFLLLMVLWLY